MTSRGAQIITFYSYKGGTGRSMHLANVAWILASNGKRVLAVDWDLEAPGLHRYFRPFLIDKELTATEGLIDLMWDFADAAMTPVPEAERARGWHEAYADLPRCTTALRGPLRGRIDLLPAGRQTASYSRRVNSFNWQNFYDRLGGGVFLESIKARMREDYDYVLIDSRTGVSDTAGICTVQMPDTLVLCFTANNQSIEGCASIAESVRTQWSMRGGDREEGRILPLLTRVDGSEKDKLNGRRALARSKFDRYVQTSDHNGSIDDYWRDIEVPYVPWYSYEEVLAVFADKYKEKISVLDSAEALARVLTHGEIAAAVRPHDDSRLHTLAQFTTDSEPMPDTQPARPPERPVASPYPGLRPFSIEDASVFFGRTAELDELVARLRAGERQLCVTGPSGCGKSSLIYAGLIPLLARIPPERTGGRYLVRSFRPDADPFELLARALDAEAVTDEHDLCDSVAAALTRNVECDRLLIIVDELEALFAARSVDVARWVVAIRALRSEVRATLLFVLRDDFFGAFRESLLWTDLDGRLARLEIAPLHGDALREVITYPARRVGVRVEPALVERLVADTCDQPGALPLLQLTLAELWHVRRDDVLTAASYAKFGKTSGMVGDKLASDRPGTALALAISGHADAALRSLTRTQETIALRILIRLVHFGEGRADTRRQQLRTALSSDGDAPGDLDAVLQRLVETRLVTVSAHDHSAEMQVDLAHEALIHEWRTFADWVRTWRARELHRRDLEACAAAWRLRGRTNEGILDPVELTDALAWRATAAQSLGESADVAALVIASETFHAGALRRRRRRARSISAGLIVVTAVTSILAVVASRNARDAERERAAALDQRSQALEQRNHNRQLLDRSSHLYQETGRQLLVDAQRPLQALPYLVAARSAREASGEVERKTDSALRLLFAEATRNLPVARFAHQSVMFRAAFSPDGRRLATASEDGTARVWDIATGNAVTPPLKHRDGVWNVVFDPDGKRLATASWDGTARVWDATTGQPLAPPLQHRDLVWSALFSRDGTWIVTASSDKSARVWSAATGEPATPPLVHRDNVWSAAFSDDGTRVVTSSADGTAQVWDAVTGRALGSPLVHRAGVRTAVFSSDGRRVLTASDDHTAQIWDLRTYEPVGKPLQHDDTVWKAAFSPDGRCVVTASLDHSARVWDAATGLPITPRLEHAGAVFSAAFSSDGAAVVTASADCTARVWNAATGRPVTQPLEHQDSVRSAVFSPGGDRVATVSADRTASVWNVSATVPSILRIEDDSSHDATSSRDARTVLKDNSAQVLDASGAPISPPLLHQKRIREASLSPDGSLVVTASDDQTARVWDVKTGRPITPPLPHQETVWTAAFSPDGTRVVTASEDGTARIWDAASGQPMTLPLQHRGPVRNAVFSPDGARVVTTSDPPGEHMRSTAGKSTPPQHDRDAAARTMFSSDGTSVVTARVSVTIRVWDAATGKPLTIPHDTQLTTAVGSISPGSAWEPPLASGTLADWTATAERASPYVLVNGVLATRPPVPTTTAVLASRRASLGPN